MTFKQGDDCGATGNDLWLKYVRATLDGVVIFPPKSGVAEIVVTTKADVKDVKIEVDKAGKTFTITGPRDVEKGVYTDTIENGFKRVSSKG